MDPITLSLLIAAGPAIFQGIQGIKQTREGKEMQKNLGARVNYEIPEEAKKALALAQGLASSREMPGQAGMQAMMDLQAQKAFGNASRAAMSSQDLLGVATNLGEQAQENQLNLGIQAAQNYQQRQQALQQALGTMAGYQEKKTADRQQDWYERAQAAAAMRGAGMENTMGALQGLTGGLMQGLTMGADAGMFQKTRPSLSEGVEKMTSIGAPQLPINGTDPGLMTGSTITGRNVYLGPSSISGTSTAQLPVNQTGLMPRTSVVGLPNQINQIPTPITTQTPVYSGTQMPTSTNPYVQGAWGQTPQSVMDLMKFLGTSGNTNVVKPATGQQMMSRLLDMGLQPGIYTNPATINAQNAAASGQVPQSVASMLNLMMLNNR